MKIRKISSDSQRNEMSEKEQPRVWLIMLIAFTRITHIRFHTLESVHSKKETNTCCWFRKIEIKFKWFAVILFFYIYILIIEIRIPLVTRSLLFCMYQLVWRHGAAHHAHLKHLLCPLCPSSSMLCHIIPSSRNVRIKIGAAGRGELGYG